MDLSPVLLQDLAPIGKLLEKDSQNTDAKSRQLNQLITCLCRMPKLILWLVLNIFIVEAFGLAAIHLGGKMALLGGP